MVVPTYSHYILGSGGPSTPCSHTGDTHHLHSSMGHRVCQVPDGKICHSQRPTLRSLETRPFTGPINLMSLTVVGCAIAIYLTFSVTNGTSKI